MDAINVTPEAEVDLICHYLSKKYDRQVVKRVRLSGYADEPTYALEVTVARKDWRDEIPTVIVIGNTAKDPIQIYKCFLEHYWKDRQYQDNIEQGKEKPLLSSTVEILENECIAKSRSELLLKAQIEGLI